MPSGVGGHLLGNLSRSLQGQGRRRGVLGGPTPRGPGAAQLPGSAWMPGPRVEHRGEFQGVVSTPLFTGAPLWTPSRTCHSPSEGDRRAIRPGSRPRGTATAAQAARVGSGYAGRGPPFAAAKSSPTSPQRNEGLSCFCGFLDRKLQPSLHFPVGHSFSQKLPTAPPVPVEQAGNRGLLRTPEPPPLGG